MTNNGSVRAKAERYERIWGNYIPVELRQAIKGESGPRSPEHLDALLEVEHELVAMYVIGVMAKLEALTGTKWSWDGEGIIAEYGQIDAIPETDVKALWLMRNGLVHGGGDLMANGVPAPPPDVESVIKAWPGVALDQSAGGFRVMLSADFITQARNMLLATAKQLLA